MILRGWKNICAALDGMSETTARQLMREARLPVCIVAGKPMTTSTALSRWVLQKCQENSWSLPQRSALSEHAEAKMPFSG